MSAPRHTPGPWRIITRGPSNPSYHAVASGEQPIADLYYGAGIRATELEGNAAIIAAAPDLLEALEGVLRVADRATVEFDAARAAIAKARGGVHAMTTAAYRARAIECELRCDWRAAADNWQAAISAYPRPANSAIARLDIVKMMSRRDAAESTELARCNID